MCSKAKLVLYTRKKVELGINYFFLLLAYSLSPFPADRRGKRSRRKDEAFGVFGNILKQKVNESF
jgi:hypothetical protein